MRQMPKKEQFLIPTNKGNILDACFAPTKPLVKNMRFISQEEVGIADMVAKHSGDYDEWKWKFMSIVTILGIESAWFIIKN